MQRSPISKRAVVGRVLPLIAVATLLSIVSIQAQEAGEASGKATKQTLSTTAETVNYQAYAAGQWKDSEQIYHSFCIYCHDTGIGPVILGRDYPAQAVPLIVRHGAYTMPTFRPSEINDEELEALAKWVSESAGPTPQPKNDKGEAK